MLKHLKKNIEYWYAVSQKPTDIEPPKAQLITLSHVWLKNDAYITKARECARLTKEVQAAHKLWIQ